MQIHTIPVGPLWTNCYIVADDVKNAVIIDPGFEAWKISALIDENGYKPGYIILTHGHYDHKTAAVQLKEKYGIPVVISRPEAPFMTDRNLNLSVILKRIDLKLEPADILVGDGEALTCGELEFKFILTPGHTAGSMCIICGDSIFTGDTLFAGDVGRTDLPTGNEAALRRSIKEKLAVLDFDYKVYPGHMKSTTLFHEKKNNPHFN